jgi:uncharacterized protein YdeI (YjbR/CyaY-like superfamily)
MKVETETKEHMEVRTFETAADWEAWLESHHANTDGIWLKFAKKESGIPSVSFPDALILAMGYGWIDSRREPYDNVYYLQKYTPRRPRSAWSKLNRERAEGLIADGRMKPAGMREVEAARADGRWDRAYEPQAQISVPEDLQAELDRSPAAQEFFNILKGANRYAILYRIQTAKKPETRAARIHKFVEMLERKEKIYP